MSVEAAKIVINVSADGADKATAQMGKLDDSLGSVGSSLTALATSAALLAAANKLVQFASDATKAFAEAQSAAVRLDKVAKMRGMDEAAGNITKLAQAIQRLTGADADQTAQIGAELLAQGKSEAMIKKMITAAANLAAVTGQDLNSAVEQLNGTLGGMARELGKTNPEIKALTEEQLRSGAAIDIISKKYEGMADSMSNTLEVTTRIREEAGGDLAEAFGEQLAPAMTSVNSALTGFYQIAQQALSAFGQLPGPVKNGAIAFGALAVVIPAVGTALVALGPVINMIKIAMVGMGGPVVIALTAVVVAVTAITTAIWGSIDAQNQLNDAMSKTSQLSKKEQFAVIENTKAKLESQLSSFKKLQAEEFAAYGKEKYYVDEYAKDIATVTGKIAAMNARQKELAKELGDEAAASKAAAEASKAYQAGTQGSVKAIDEKKQAIADLLGKLQEEFETYGMSNTALLEYNLRKKGATEAEIAFAKSVQTGIDALKAQDQAQKDAAKSASELESEVLATAAGMNEWALAFESENGMSPADKINDLKTAFANAKPYIDAAASALGGVQQLIQNIGDAELMRAEEELAKNKEVWDAKLAQAEADGATTEQLAELKKQAAAETGAEEEKLDARRKQIMHDNAVMAKAFALMNATVNGAAAVVAALPNVPLAILTGISAAAQIAAIVATPIPAAQFGGDFVVPPGYGGDSGLLRVNSGEQVSVTPARESGVSSGKSMVLSIGGREFDAYMEEQVGNAMNSGRVTVRRAGVVRA